MRFPMPLKSRQLQLLSILCAALLPMVECQPDKISGNSLFTLAVIPDTQNYIDFRHQKSVGFELDSRELFIQQMQHIADHSIANGGDIAFVASVGDVWQHQTETIDQEHLQRGIDTEPDPGA